MANVVLDRVNKAFGDVRALHDLSLEVQDQHIDGDLVGIFTEARVWEQSATSPLSERR